MRITRTATGVQVETGSGFALPIRHIIGIGLNYAAHAKETGKGVPERPVLFSKNPFSACLHGDRIVIPRICQDRPQVDFEAELGVIVGTQPDGAMVRDVPADRALACVAAYVCANDVSARWWQKDGSGGQFNRGKSFDTFCPVGPRAVAPAEVGVRRGALRPVGGVGPAGEGAIPHPQHANPGPTKNGGGRGVGGGLVAARGSSDKGAAGRGGRRWGRPFGRR
ncbi:MAG: fumarylacetoacetate hydrolase family protein [Phycisphaerae bacterium]